MNPGMALTTVSIPDSFGTQPLSECHGFFPERQGEQGFCCQYAEWRAFKLHLEHFSPLFVSKTDVLVSKGPCYIFQLSFPLGGWLP